MVDGQSHIVLVKHFFLLRKPDVSEKTWKMASCIECMKLTPILKWDLHLVKWNKLSTNNGVNERRRHFINMRCCLVHSRYVLSLTKFDFLDLLTGGLI